MRNLVCIILTILLMQSSIAQVTWISPTPLGNDLMSLAFADIQHGVVVGKQGTLLLTGNGGENWEVILTGGKQNFSSVAWFNNRYYAMNGNILTSADGRHWATHYSHPEHSFSSISFIDEMHWYAWAPGTLKDNLAYTTDGGHSWRFVYRQPLANASGIVFVDSTTGFAKTSYSILKTNDAGITWNTIYSVDDETFSGFSYKVVNKDVILFYGRVRHNMGGQDEGIIERSSDGGVSWTPVLRNYQLISAWRFADSLHGYAACVTEPQDGSYYVDNKLLTTSDGGLTWEQHPMPDFGYYAGIWIHPTGKIQLVGAGGRMTSTSDTGVTWQRQSGGFIDASIEHLYSLGGNHLFMEADTGDRYHRWYRSNDAGMTWVKANGTCYTEFAAFSDSLHGFLLDRKIDTLITYYTTDGGFNWQVNEFPMTSMNEGEFSTPAPGALFVKIYNDSVFCFTTDYGSTYTVRYLPHNGKLFFLSVDTGYLVTINPWEVTFNITHDRGLTWNSKSLGVYPNFTSVRYFRAFSNNFWVLGLSGADYSGNPISDLLLSSDGGATWRKVYPFGSNYGNFSFNEKGEGRIMVNNSTMYTPDAGITWIAEEFYFPYNYQIQTLEDGSSVLYGEVLIHIKGYVGPYGISELSSKFTLKVFPVPATELLIFQTTDSESYQGQLSLFNIHGQCVLTTSGITISSSLPFTLDIAGMPSGIYLYRFAHEKGIISGKVIISR